MGNLSKMFGISFAIMSMCCGAVAQEKVTLTVWSSPGHDLGAEEAQRQAIEEFERQNPDIEIRLTLLPEQGFIDRMTTILGSGSGAPDVFPIFEDNWRPYALDLMPFIEADDEISPEIYIPSIWRTRALFEDKVVGLPLGVGANLVLFNRDYFDAADIPYPDAEWTTQDFLDLAVQLTDPSRGVWGGDRPNDAYRTIWRNYGAQVYSDDSLTVDGYHNSPESLAAFEWYWDLIDSGATPSPADIQVLGTEATGPVDLFLAGRLAMATLNQTHMLRAMQEDINFGVLPEPAAPNGTDRYANIWSATVGIYQGTQYPDEAWRFVKFFAGPDGQEIQMNTGLNMFPSIPTLLPHHPVADDPQVEMFLSVLDQPNTVRDFDGSHLCWRAAVRRAYDTFQLISLGRIARDEIQQSLDADVERMQAALDECRARLGS